ncbi:exonuclease I [Luminiphilus syltensis NOR5-1B]|uniref:Exodeoxyribonuclease I n=2 Tax=Luminiphilus TaxID=1341118 RepID=B8KX06_9GAMM|nr:exonuclease I [Luminiphilus syltensis NOR5-1B]
MDRGDSECDFVDKIHAALAVPGTCGVGYNSIRFDDEVMRFALYRNFFDPYQREYANGNSRWDLIDVARAIYALRPEGTQWPARDNGLPSFRLEDLTAANGIAHGAAHDALSDVDATIDLARHFQNVQPALFAELLSMRRKRHVETLMDLGSLRPVVHVSSMYGSDRSNLALVVPLVRHPVNRNEIICADLSQPPDFLSESATDMAARLFTPASELPEGAVRPPIKTIHINKSPVVLNTQWVRGEVAERLGLDGEAHRRHLAEIRQANDKNPEGLKQRLQDIYSERRFAPRTDPDVMLYDGFFPNSDRSQFDGLRAASPEQLASGWVFEDARLEELLFRYRARNFPATLDAEESARWQEHCRHRYFDADAPFPLTAFREELAQERSAPDLSDSVARALDALEDYVQTLL